MKKLSMEEIDRGEQMEKNVAARSYCRAYREGAIAFNGGHWRAELVPHVMAAPIMQNGAYYSMVDGSRSCSSLRMMKKSQPFRFCRGSSDQTAHYH
ncbi:hypothetical protein WN944_010886 [Citrus x changshan-huyou]|uniref:Uncharacterized protein n=1 Tax=Citrus x changshan-huyou TaxID=2935761 RepID=A0AAP0MSG1_9ROSI